MSERGNFRGSSRGRGDRGGGRGGHRGGGAAGGQQQQSAERPKKENILDLSRFIDKDINVSFSGGREGLSILLHLLPFFFSFSYPS